MRIPKLFKIKPAKKVIQNAHAVIKKLFQLKSIQSTNPKALPVIWVLIQDNKTSKPVSTECN